MVRLRWRRSVSTRQRIRYNVPSAEAGWHCGSISVVSRLSWCVLAPATCTRCGTARKGDSMLHWPMVWWRTYTPKLVQMGYLMQSDADELMRDLAEIERSDTDYVLVPPVFEIVAEKP